MAWPTRGQQAPNFWDVQLKEYIDEGGAEGLTARVVDLEALTEELDATKADELDLSNLDTRVTTLEENIPPASQRTRLAADFTGTVSNIVMEVVPGLSIALGANEEWDFEVLLHVQGTTAGDLEIDFTGPAGVTLFAMHVISLPGSVTAIGGGARPVSIMALSTTSGKLGLISASTVPVQIKGTIVTGGTAGTLQLRAAQSVSDATAHIIRTGSSITAVQVA